MNSVIGIPLLFTLTSFSVPAICQQSLVISKEEAVIILNKINTAYSKSDKYILNFTYNLFDSPGSLKVEETGKGVVRRMGNKYYVSQLETETFIDGENQLSVFHGSKLIYISKARHKPEELIFSSQKALATLKVCSSVTQTQINDSIATLNLMVQNMEFTSIAVVYSTLTFRIVKVVVQYAAGVGTDEANTVDAPRIEVVYDPVIFDPPSLKESDFLWSKFVVKDNGQWKAAGAYSQYRVIDQISEK